ncbi:MAG: undecaprenyldiphospho-muramoylpentapeptide beta-N-acetylglucosaminyltransferase [Arcanobacterium sp.]|nr:undecaprenyldiphospho-muramoylpentapeptide beta-N-acetylglucosaminyltransferase [Arcanobacterium sp.]MDY5588617.1 undecaprenyldiphospho-muramoylpentapeptide beta-N-acetylglucosaminyltransferase [Arcanobacterium sp.]
MKANVVLAAGGTAGHVNPMLATARALRELDPEISVTAVGTEHGLEARLVPQAGVPLEFIPRVPMPRALGKAAFAFPGNFRRAVAQAGVILERVQANVVIGFGGYVSTPVYLAARKRGIPVVAHEGNARPGLANKLAAHFAAAVALTFSNTRLRARRGRTETIGLPMRTAIVDLAQAPGGRRSLAVQAAAKFGIDPNKPVLFVTGGSQGAQHINEVVSGCSAQLRDAGIQVLHLTGAGKDEPVRAAVEGAGGTYVVLDYLEHIEQAYALADLVITRSGAGMVAEVSALGIPAVFVPFPIGNGEQALNAHDVVAAGGALLVRNENFTEDWLVGQVLPLFQGDRLAQMAGAAQSVSALNAAQRLAQIALEVAR